MADLKFDVDYSDLSRSLDVLMEMGKASKNTATAFEQSFRQIKRWQDTFKGQQGKINAELETTNQRLRLANKSAKDSAAAFIAHEKAIEGNTDALNRMRMGYDSTYAVEQRTLQLKRLLRQEIANNRMTVREAGAELLKYRKQMIAFNQVQMAATKSSNRMGVVTQQAGYQVSDFIVQVQSGTNPFVAFSQQASQLAGVLPLVAGSIGLTTTAAIGLSAALGVGIPLIGAFGAALLNSRKAASESAEGIKTYEEALQSLNQEIKENQALAIKQLTGSDERLVKLAEKRLELVDGIQEAQNKIAQGKGNEYALSTVIIPALEEQLAKETEIFNTIVKRQRRAKELVEQTRRTERAKEDLKSLEQETLETEIKILDTLYRIDVLRNNGIVSQSILKEEVLDTYRRDLQRKGLNSTLIEDLVEQKSALIDQETRLDSLLKKESQRITNAAFLAQYNPLNSMSLTDEEIVMAQPLTPAEQSKPKTAPTGKKRDPLAELRKQLDLESELIGKTETRQRVIKALGLDYMKYGKATINSLETQINKTIFLKQAEEDRQKTLEDARQKQKEVADDIAGSMGDAFMSIVDGTKSVKDAFRDMARYIIGRLYEILVVEQMVQSISGAIQGAMIGPVQGPMLPSANGNVFSNGSVVPYANGGIVGSPVYFPMAGGRTGLMGEAGPEAIMPLKRGKNGKLGVQADGGGDITINQSFNFAANGDDSVKKIIAQQAPKIAQMTQQQIMDSRRRGGQMKAVFG